MGHFRIGALVKTRPWRAVVDLITAGADAATVAEATMRASQKALEYVQEDAGFREAVHLLVQLGVAASKDDPAAHLVGIGVDLPAQAGL